MADSLLSAPLLAPVAAQTLGWIAIWALSLFGLGQTPGFDGRWLEPQTSTASVSPKYRKSALTSQQADRVAGRIESIMRAEHLYLDPALSLPKLAARLNISPNLVSQTLNERLGKSFFAYVNAWRIEAAAPLVLAREHSMLEIALEVGFNSKSAFYKSFNVSFGMSPSSYLKRCATPPQTSAQQTDQALGPCASLAFSSSRGDLAAGLDLAKLRLGDIAQGGAIRQRSTIVQQKTGRPAPFEITKAAREALTHWLERRGWRRDDWLFPKPGRAKERGGMRSSTSESRSAKSNRMLF